MASTREAVDGGEVTKGLSSFKKDMNLNDTRIIDIKPEAWWNGPTVVMLTLFPNLIVQQQSNSMSTRQIMPRGTGAFDFVWTHFGFEEDDPDMALRRLRQANMFGPAGYVSADGRRGARVLPGVVPAGIVRSGFEPQHVRRAGRARLERIEPRDYRERVARHVRLLAQDHGDLTDAGRERRLRRAAKPVRRLLRVSRRRESRTVARVLLDECEYRIQPRENYERQLPLSIMWLESKGMLKDRIYGVRNTLYHDPYYQRHVVSAPRVTAVDGDEIRSEANYLVLRTKRDEFAEVFNVGRYIDKIHNTPDGLKFKSRLCIFDSELIKNSIIYPI